ncbi:MAG: hypothetical protein KOO69_06115 [Victivallales bacterium]|nr:hypothetical protein [Victivallales bacterium]
MIYKTTEIQIHSVDYNIHYDSGTEIATITPTVHITCAKTQILVASINVDDHELRPSLKLILDEGERSYIVPYVRIGRPFLSSPDDKSKDKEYKITLKLHLGNDKIHDLDEYIKIIKE